MIGFVGRRNKTESKGGRATEVLGRACIVNRVLRRQGSQGQGFSEQVSGEKCKARSLSHSREGLCGWQGESGE